MVKLVDYINDCLKNPEFRKYWEEEDFLFPEEQREPADRIPSDEAPTILEEEDLSEK